MLTTSYPRHPGDAAGHFVGEAVERLRGRGIEIEVVSPAATAARPRKRTSGGGSGEPGGSPDSYTFAHYGIAYGHGVVGNLRRAPLRAVLLPAMVASFRRAAARAARDADLVHAHWLPAGAIARTLGKPYVVQVWGTDMELARHVPWLARPILRRARRVIAASTWLADAARALGAERVDVIPSGVDLPADVSPPAEPPEVLYAGRLSPEKGVLDLVAAANGLPLVVAGDGPLRDRVPSALGFVPHDELERLYARAAVVACPSRREGFGVVCAEAMAHGRPVVASTVGGLLDLVVDGETGLLVPPGDPAVFRAALQKLLGDPELRARLGVAARERIRERFAWDAVLDATVALYEEAAA